MDMSRRPFNPTSSSRDPAAFPQHPSQPAPPSGYPRIPDSNYSPQSAQRPTSTFMAQNATPPVNRVRRTSAYSTPMSPSAAPSLTSQLYPAHLQAFVSTSYGPHYSTPQYSQGSPYSPVGRVSTVAPAPPGAARPHRFSPSLPPFQPVQHQEQFNAPYFANQRFDSSPAYNNVEQQQAFPSTSSPIVPRRSSPAPPHFQPVQHEVHPHHIENHTLRDSAPVYDVAEQQQLRSSPQFAPARLPHRGSQSSSPPLLPFKPAQLQDEYGSTYVENRQDNSAPPYATIEQHRPEQRQPSSPTHPPAWGSQPPPPPPSHFTQSESRHTEKKYAPNDALQVDQGDQFFSDAAAPAPAYEPPPPPPPAVPAEAVHSTDNADNASIDGPPPSTADEDELARAIALSQSESMQHHELQEKLRRQEDEDLARALAESMMSTGSGIRSSYNAFFFDESQPATSSKVTLDSPVLVHTPPESTPEVTAPPKAEEPVTVSSEDYPEFGRYNKWRIPDLHGAEQSDNFVEPESEVAIGKRPALADDTAAQSLAVSPNSDSSNSSSSFPQSNGEGGDSNTLSQSSPEVHGLASFLFEEEPEKIIRRPREEAVADKAAFDANPPTPYSDINEPLSTASNLNDDEALAFRLAAEEAAISLNQAPFLSTPTSNATVSVEPLQPPPPSLRPDSPSELPYYNDDRSATPTPVQQSFPPQYDNNPQPYPTSPHPASAMASPPPRPPPPHSTQSAPAVTSSSLSSSPVQSSNSLPLRQDPAASMPSLARISSNSNLPNNFRAMDSPEEMNAGAGQTAAAYANHFIDPALLLGVSMGFVTPPISQQLRPMEGAVPNIISLPYGRCPPLHIQAPSWKHMLKLLARMSGTKLEPTIQAMAVTKTELKLRTVVQFLKPHLNSQEWRTILWFSIDQPVPPSAPAAPRYLNPHPNILPWSFTVNPLPHLLQSAADTPISKTYTIPATDSLPYPTLPISSPNLAIYLQAALDFSRQQKDDSSNGYRRLAKMVQMCYPNSEDNSLEPVEKATVSDLFKRVIGRGGNKNKKGKTNNEETYEFITPFVPDEWG